MTTEERAKLIDGLRSNQCQSCDCRQCAKDRIVADELERMAKENAELKKENARLAKENAELRAKEKVTPWAGWWCS